MKRIAYHILALTLLLLTACSGGDSFKVDGTVDGGRTMNLRFLYVGDDNLNNVLTAARDGKFLFQGHAPEGGTLVEVLDNDYRPLAYFYAENGDKIKVNIKGNSAAGAVATGNDAMDRWNEWREKNANVIARGPGKPLNAAVANYVENHKEDIVSALLMAVYYDASIDPHGANRLLEGIVPEARPAAVAALHMPGADMRDAKGQYNRVPVFTYFSSRTDTLATFRPRDHKRTLLAFTAGRSGRDSIIRELSRLYRDKPAGVDILDLRFDTDTVMWRRDLRVDSVKWTSAWMPEATAAPGIDRLGVRSLPFFIVADSTGAQLYHGPGIVRAAEVARRGN